MNESHKQTSANPKSISANDLEEYDPPEIHDLGDVSAITKSGFNGAGTDGGYS
jgi:hypothetical protein